jgi:hypothetical protein
MLSGISIYLVDRCNVPLNQALSAYVGANEGGIDMDDLAGCDLGIGLRAGFYRPFKDMPEQISTAALADPT